MEADYSVNYDEVRFWEKIKKFAKKAGREVLETAVILYYALQDPTTPLWAKTVIVGALGYFISPIDAIPDVIPVIGYSDDLLVLAGALATVAACITPEHKSKAKNTVKEWLD